MKSHGSSSSSDSLQGSEKKDISTFIPITLAVDHNNVKYEGDAQSVTLTKMEEVEEDEEEMNAHITHTSFGEKKRRLSVEQVKALEKNFEVENKLDPERKIKIASDLGLQPRQVAVWFQNRRARWKTKQLEHDYNALKDRYNVLKIEFDSLNNDKESLTLEINELKAKLQARNCSASAMKMDTNKIAQDDQRPTGLVFKDGASDSSDSSVVFNDEVGSSLVLEQQCVLRPQCSSLIMFNDEIKLKEEDYLDEEGLMSGEELCSSLFSEDQTPSLSWYYNSSQAWN